MSGRRGLLWLVAGLALVLLAGRWFAGVYGDWAFHHAVGADALWRERALMSLTLRAATFSLAFAFGFANFFAVRQSIVALVLPREVGGLHISEAIPTRRLTLLAFGVAALLATLFTLADQDWTVLAQALHGLPFGESDPYLERDLAFYVNTLPLEQMAFDFITVVVATTSLFVITGYVVTPSVRWDERGLYVSAWVRRHMGVLGAIGIALLAWHWRLERFDLLAQGTGVSRFAGEVPEFSLHDHRTLLPYLYVLSFAALPLGFVFGFTVWRGLMRPSIAIVTSLIVAGPVARLILPVFTPPTTGNREAEERRLPYEATRLLYSRRAFGVDQIASPDTLPLRMLGEGEVARWVSAWDPAALMRFLERERRGTDVAALSWMPGLMGLEAQLVRRAPADAPPGTRWPADRLRADATDANRLPRPSLVPGNGGIGGVLVYPGATRYALVADTLGRLAAPPFETTIQRVGLAWDQQNPRLLATEGPQPRPKLMTERDALKRLQRLTPFLSRGETVTPVVRGDSLYWVVELFTTSETYPLSERQPIGPPDAPRLIHYAQHAATAVVQAQSGAVMILPVDRPDPVMRTWMRLLPSLFTARERAPRWMATGLPPAVDWALLQGRMLGRTGSYGDTLPVRQVERIDDADADLLTGPPTLFQLDTMGTLAWGVPVANADRLAGLLVAQGGLHPRTTLLAPGFDRDWNGILEDLQESADRAGFGRVLADSRRGRVQSVPTARGPMFVQSFYQWPADGPPRLVGVVAVRGTERRVGRTLADALGQAPAELGRDVPSDAFRAQVVQLYDAMAAAQRVGDWKAYGDAWAALGRLIGRPPR